MSKLRTCMGAYLEPLQPGGRDERDSRSAATDRPEHDAWLREALRHAPDASASPPPSAARRDPGRGARRRRAPATPRHGSVPSLLDRALAFWSWLARPQVAAGFASVMAATLVGMLWWDRPMDETMLPPPAVERSEAPRVAAPEAAPPAAKDAADATAAAPAAAPPAPMQMPTSPARAAPAPEAKIGDTANAARARAKDNLLLRDGGAPRKNDAPTDFPSGELERLAPAAPSAATGDAKKEAATTPAPSPAPFAAERATPATAAPAVPPPAPVQSGRLAGDDARPLATPMRQRSIAEARPNELDAFASSGAAARSEQQKGSVRRDEAAAMAPLAPLLAALASDGARWSRRMASGGATAVEPAWRDWLTDLDAAARWQRGSAFGTQAGAEAEKAGANVLRLDVDGRPAAVVRLDGSTARVEIIGAGVEHWQATLPAAAAERLRAALARLPS